MSMLAQHPAPAPDAARTAIRIPPFDSEPEITFQLEGASVIVTAAVTFRADVDKTFPADLAEAQRRWSDLHGLYLEKKEWLPEFHDALDIISAAVYGGRVNGSPLEVDEYLRQYAEIALNAICTDFRATVRAYHRHRTDSLTGAGIRYHDCFQPGCDEPGRCA